jgi:hypothetical protein
MDQTKSDLKELLLMIVQNQNDAAAMITAIRADLETLTLAMYAVAPQFAANLGTALTANRARYAAEIESKKAELELLRARVSSLVQ